MSFSVGPDLLTRYAIVPLETVHLHEVCEIERASYSKPWSRSAFEYEIDKNPVSWSRVALATDSPGQVAGYCVAWFVFEHVHIQNIAVHPSHRRQGLGRLLVQRILDEGLARNATTALLEARRSNLAARSLYLELGFRETGARRDYYSLPREDAVVFQKDLAPGPGET